MAQSAVARVGNDDALSTPHSVANVGNPAAGGDTTPGQSGYQAGRHILQVMSPSQVPIETSTALASLVPQQGQELALGRDPRAERQHSQMDKRMRHSRVELLPVETPRLANRGRGDLLLLLVAIQCAALQEALCLRVHL